MKIVKCIVCSRNVILPGKTIEEQYGDVPSTKYWALIDEEWNFYCDAYCSLEAYMKDNNQKIPDWLTDEHERVRNNNDNKNRSN